MLKLCARTNHVFTTVSYYIRWVFFMPGEIFDLKGSTLFSPCENHKNSLWKSQGAKNRFFFSSWFWQGGIFWKQCQSNNSTNSLSTILFISRKRSYLNVHLIKLSVGYAYICYSASFQIQISALSYACRLCIIFTYWLLRQGV